MIDQKKKRLNEENTILHQLILYNNKMVYGARSLKYRTTAYMKNYVYDEHEKKTTEIVHLESQCKLYINLPR